MRLMSMPLFSGQAQPGQLNNSTKTNSSKSPRFGQDEVPNVDVFDRTYTSTSRPHPHKAMLNYFFDNNGTKIDTEQSREAHDTLLQMMFTHRIKTSLIDKYHKLVKEHYGE